VPAKKDPDPGKLELRLLFFSSLIFISFGKALESRFHHVAGCIKRESRLQASGEAVNFVSNTGSKLLVYQRQLTPVSAGSQLSMLRDDTKILRNYPRHARYSFGRLRKMFDSKLGRGEPEQSSSDAIISCIRDT
jgi:hypothetical protein